MLADELHGLVGNFEIRSRRSFRLFGQSYRAPGTIGVSDLALGDDARSMLASLLYTMLHCRAPLAHDPARSSPDPVAVRDFTERLSLSNTTKSCLQAGWMVMGHDGERVEVAKHGVRWFVSAQHVRSDTGLEVGTSVHVRISKEQRELFPGYYMAFGNADDADPRLLRFYWNLSAEGATHLVAHVSERFNRATIPFRMKLLKIPDAYRRSDAAVLYLSSAWYDVAHRVVAEIAPSIRPFLSPAVSAFVKRISEGIGLAEDPGPGKSFGQFVSRILADSLSVGGARSGGTKKRARIVEAALHGRGIDPEQPYLLHGSTIVYRRLDA